MGVQVDKLESPKEIQETVEVKTSKLGYLAELKKELRLVTWTSKDELVTFTKIVVGATFAFGLGIYGVDLLIKNCLNGFKTLILLIFG